MRKLGIFAALVRGNSPERVPHPYLVRETEEKRAVQSNRPTF